MRAALRLCVISLFLIASTGCLKLKVLVSLNQDGSGTVTFTHLMTNASIKQIVTAANRDGADTSEAAIKEQIHTAFSDETLLKEFAKEFGKVQFSKVEKVDKDNHTGVTITYTFQDINDVKINAISPLGTSGEGGINYGASFSYSPDARTLIITTNAADEAQQQPLEDGQIDMLMKQLDDTSGLVASLDVRMPGVIIQTDASQVSTDKQQVSLFNADLDRLKQDKPKLKQAMTTNNSFDKLLSLKLDGMQAEKQGAVISTSF